MLSNSKIHDVYRNAFIMMTEKMTGFTIQETSGKEMKYQYDILIQSKGNFESVITCHMESTLYEAVLIRMNAGKLISPELKHLYIGEYINVVCGHALSNINNLLGAHSRLTIPEILKEDRENVKNEYTNDDVMYFKSAYGSMKIEMSYA